MKHFLLAIVLFLPGFLCAEPSTGNFSVRSFGALGDGRQLDSPAVNSAIDAAAEAGGGTVYFPAGTYLCGSIRLKSNIHLRIDAGAVVLAAPQNMDAYDFPETFEGPAYQDGGHTYFRTSLIWGENLRNVSITGQGMIDGRGLTREDGNQDILSGFVLFGKEPPHETQPAASERLGNKAIALKSCLNVLIRDITIVRGGHFAVLATGCSNVTIDNLTADTNRDGINIDSCRQVVISNCRINAPYDDAICIKSSYALGKNVATEDLTITNCHVSAYKEGSLVDGTFLPHHDGHSRIKLGTESNGGYRNIAISNCTFRNSRGLALEEVDGGIMENITVSNIVMTDVTDYPIYITTGKRNRGPEVSTVSQARNILITNVVATNIDPRSGIQITGMPEKSMENIRLQNIRLIFKGGGTREQAEATFRELGAGYPDPSHLDVTPSYGVFARHVDGLELADIHLDFVKEDLRPALFCENIHGLQIDNVNAKVTKEVDRAIFKNVSGVVIRDSPGIAVTEATSPR